MVKKKLITILGFIGIIGICGFLLLQKNPSADTALESFAEMKPSSIEELEEGEFRAAWISTVYNLDWPSKKGLTKEEQQQEFILLLNQLQESGLNAVMVQIKPTADSFYPSVYSPWSEYLMGKQGEDPGYDPLAFMIEEVHRRGMEFHAWFNPYRVSVKDDMNLLSVDHPARMNPSWVVAYGGQLYYNPGIPEVRNFVRESIMEVVRNYPIDGVHLDDYFYPYPVKDLDFPDDYFYNTLKRHPLETKEEWRRNNINEFIKDLYSAIKNEKRQVKFGVSPFGVWRNQSVDPLGSNTRASITSYDSLYADTKLWVEEGWLDYIAPQIYWHFGYAPAPYEVLLKWWSSLTEGKDIHLYIGQAAYKVQPEEGPWGNPYEILNQIDYNRNVGNAKGSILFRAKSIINNPLNLKDYLKTTVYHKPVSTPAMPWLESIEETQAIEGMDKAETKENEMLEKNNEILQ